MRRPLTPARLVVLIAGALLGCAESTSSPADEGIKSVQVSTLVVAQGFDASTVMVVDRGSTYRGEITLAAEAVPPGLRVAITPATLVDANENAQLTVSAPVSVQPGPYTFKVRASGNGVESRTSTVSIEVAVPSFSVNVTTQQAQLEQGGTVSVPITVARAGGYPNPIDLSLSGVPAEVSAVIMPSRLQPGQTTAQLQLSASYLASPANVTIVVRASALGLPQQTAAVPLSVVPSTTPAIHVVTGPLIETFRGLVRTHTVNVMRFGGYSGDVSFRLIGGPPEVTMTSAPLAGGQTSALLSFAVPVSVPQGNYQAKLRVEPTSLSPVELPVTVRVSTIRAFEYVFPDGGYERGQFPEFFIARGETLQVRLQTTRYVETDIKLSAENVPAGITLQMPSVIPVSPFVTTLTTIAVHASQELTPGKAVTFGLRMRSESTGYERLSTVTLVVQ